LHFYSFKPFLLMLSKKYKLVKASITESTGAKTTLLETPLPQYFLPLQSKEDITYNSA